MGSVSDSSNGFFQSWWGLIILIVQVLAILIIVPSTQLYDVYVGEKQQIVETFGNKAGLKIHERSASVYDYLFVESGINQQTRQLFIPKSYDEGWDTEGAQKIGHREIFPYFDRRGKALSTFCRLFIQRLSQLSVWLPFVLLLFIPALIDGYFVWKRKKFSYSYSSPWLHKWAMGSMHIFLIIALVSLFLPFQINAYIFPTLGMFLAPVVAVSLSAHLPGEV